MYYIILVKGKKEFSVLEELSKKGFKSFCPTIEVRKKPRHRKAKEAVVVTVPLFDNYIFIEDDCVKDLAELKVNSDVLSLVKFGGIPGLIKRKELHSLVELLQIEFIHDIKPYEIGETLILKSGSLKLKGVYVGDGRVEAEVPWGKTFIKIGDAEVKRESSVSLL